MNKQCLVEPLGTSKAVGVFLSPDEVAELKTELKNAKKMIEALMIAAASPSDYAQCIKDSTVASLATGLPSEQILEAIKRGNKLRIGLGESKRGGNNESSS